MARHITVVGAGVVGLACAWDIARRGAAVRVVEAGRVGGRSSGGTVGALAPHAPENWNPKKQVQLDALVAAEGWWAGVRAAGGDDPGYDPGYGRTGRVQPLADHAQVAAARMRVEAAARNWPRPFGMAVTDDPGALPCPSPTGLYLHDSLTARIAPRAACAALATAVRAAGGTVEEDAGPQSPETLDGTVIWATGAPGLADLSRDLGRAVGNGVKGQSALLGFSAPGAAQVFAGGLHIVPHGDGTVAIGSTSEREFADPSATDAQLDALVARAREICPALADAPVIDAWAGVRPRAQSRAPLMGDWPGRPGHFVANGGFKIGFGMAPAMAAIMADLILSGEDRIPDGFRLG